VLNAKLLGSNGHYKDKQSQQTINDKRDSGNTHALDDKSSPSHGILGCEERKMMVVMMIMMGWDIDC